MSQNTPKANKYDGIGIPHMTSPDLNKNVEKLQNFMQEKGSIRIPEKPTVSSRTDTERILYSLSSLLSRQEDLVSTIYNRVNKISPIQLEEELSKQLQGDASELEVPEAVVEKMMEAIMNGNLTFINALDSLFSIIERRNVLLDSIAYTLKQLI